MEDHVCESDITRVAQTFMEHMCGCGDTHRIRWKEGLNKIDSTCPQEIPHKKVFMIHKNMEAIQPLLTRYNNLGPYFVNARRVADGCMYYKCKYCHNEHSHSRGVAGDNHRSSHCALKRGQVVVRLSERLANR
jgi:hypothetical protein